MNDPKTDIAERHRRIETAFAARRARLAADLVRKPARVPTRRPLAALQRGGYPAALVLAMIAALPTVVRLAWKRRKLLSKAVAAGMRVRKLGKRMKSVQAADVGP